MDVGSLECIESMSFGGGIVVDGMFGIEHHSNGYEVGLELGEDFHIHHVGCPQKIDSRSILLVPSWESLSIKSKHIDLQAH